MPFTHFKNGKVYDSLWEPITRKTTKPVICEGSKETIPKGTLYAYTVFDDFGEAVFKDKARAEKDYKSSRKNNPETAMAIIYLTSEGKLIDFDTSRY
jgi:hypothetical protein